MKMSLFYLALYYTLILVGPYCSGWWATSHSTNAVQEARRLLHKTMVAMDKALHFYLEEANVVNFDGILGMRIAEGQLTVLLKHIQNGRYPNVTRNIKTHIHTIKDFAGKVSDIATPYVAARRSSDKFDIFPMISKGFWHLDYQIRETDLSFRTPRQYDDEVIDRFENCFADVLVCKFSKNCTNKMLGEGYRFYSLSHELLYLQLAEAAGCWNDKDLKQTDLLVNEFCANMLHEAKGIARKDYEKDDQDLFMEQQALCGMMGFQDFFRADWLLKILQWQWPEGCWKTEDEKPGGKQRVKRYEKELRAGCQSHKTSVAIAALSQYVRYILHFVYKETIAN